MPEDSHELHAADPPPLTAADIRHRLDALGLILEHKPSEADLGQARQEVEALRGLIARFEDDVRLG